MNPLTTHLTSDNYSPWDLLPAPVPKDCDYPEGFFYHNVAKHLIKDTVRIMNNGLHIDLNRVEELEKKLVTILDEVNSKLANNKLIQEFQSIRYEKLLASYLEDRKSMLSTPEKYLKPFKSSDMTHRSYFMHIFSEEQSISQPSDLLPTGVAKWPAKTVNKFAGEYPILKKLTKGELSPTNKYVKLAMAKLAQDKSDMYNQKYVDQIRNPVLDLPAFSPASPQQKQQLFAHLGIESEAVSKDTGLPSWDRKQVERVNKLTTDPDIVELTQCFIDYSFAAIVKNNFIVAFYNYTVDNRLYGNLKLFGAKSFRLTSNNPNLLNMPSSGSIFSTPVKQCFTAEPDFIVATADYSALEQRVLASLANESTLIELYQNNLDGHCVHALYYFRDEISKLLTLTGDLTVDAKAFEEAAAAGNKELKAIRQRGKGPSFGLQYGAYPPKIADTIKCSLAEAGRIFTMYHEELYPNVTKYREEYVLPFAEENGYVHLGLGCNIYTDSPEKDARTIVNATSQFWSILTLLSINKMHQLIDEAGLQEDILITSSIYDSIYFSVRNDPTIVKWLNDTLIPVMAKDFIVDQKVPNLVDLELGTDWADLTLLKNNASLEEVEETLRNITN